MAKEVVSLGENDKKNNNNKKKKHQGYPVPLTDIRLLHTWAQLFKANDIVS